MRECGQRTDHRCVEHLVLLVLELKESLQHLVHREVRGVSRNAAARDDLGPLPKAEETLLPVEYSRSPEET